MKKGFTLIELLSVIIVLAIITLIAIPVMIGVMDKVRMASAKTSAYGILEAADLYYAKEFPEIKQSIDFECDGKECKTKDGKTLKIKGSMPTSGNVIIDKTKTSDLEFVVVNKYCFRGTKENLKEAKDCFKLSDKKPEVSLNIIDVTSRKFIVKINTFNEEINIKEIKYELDGKEYIDKYSKKEIEESKEFDNLKENTEYELKVTVTNENNLSETKVLNVKTESLGSVLVKFLNTPDNDNGYYQSEVAYFETEKEEKGYYIKSLRNGLVDISPKKSCTNDEIVGECKDIEATSELEANMWYYFDKLPRITYNENYDDTSTIYVLATDGYNEVLSTGTIGIIDITKPTCSLQVKEDGVSFASKEDANLESFGMNKTGTPDYNSVEKLDVSLGKYYGYVKDKAGNVTSCTAEITNTKSYWSKIENKCTANEKYGYVVTSTKYEWQAYPISGCWSCYTASDVNSTCTDYTKTGQSRDDDVWGTTYITEYYVKTENKTCKKTGTEYKFDNDWNLPSEWGTASCTPNNITCDAKHVNQTKVTCNLAYKACDSGLKLNDTYCYKIN